jgi:hypothetical protein
MNSDGYLDLAKLLAWWGRIEGNSKVADFCSSVARQIEKDPKNKPTPKQIELLKLYERAKDKSGYAGLGYMGMIDRYLTVQLKR